MRPCCVLVALLLPARAWHVRPHTRLTVAASSSRSCRRQISLSESLSRNEFAAEFDIDTAVLAAGFAFEAYNEPSERDARWERGADGCDVAFMSEAFARECYRGRLEVRLCEVKDLPCEQELAQKLLSGGNNDPYVIFALNEENEEGPKEGAIGLGRAVDRARSSTVWSKSLADAWKDKGKKPGSATWDEDERFYLYVKDPSRAQLALTVFDEEVLVDDIPLGATSIHLQDLLRAEGSDAQRSWSGWVPLTWRPAETQDNTVMLGTVAGAAVAGPAGAAVGAFVGNMIKKPVQGEVWGDGRLVHRSCSFRSLLGCVGRWPPAAHCAVSFRAVAAPACEGCTVASAARRHLPPDAAPSQLLTRRPLDSPPDRGR